MNIDIGELDLSTLLQLHAFVRADADRTFGVNDSGKAAVRAALAEVETEVYKRIYGRNPFVLGSFEGETPENIDLSKFENKGEQPFVVHTGSQPQKADVDKSKP